MKASVIEIIKRMEKVEKIFSKYSETELLFKAKPEKWCKKEILGH